MIACGPNFHPALLVLGAAALGVTGLSILLWLGALGVQLWQRAYGNGPGGDGTASPPLAWGPARRGLTWLALLATAATVAGVLMS